MNKRDFDAVREAILSEAAQQMGVKQPDYAQDPEEDTSDVLSNFKVAGLIMQLLSPGAGAQPDPAGVALLVYTIKHFIPWARAVLYGIEPKSEPLAGRAADLVNYIILGGALAKDRFGIDLFARGAAEEVS